jgi:DNA polymerase-3 subunit gamma/tau
VSQYQSLYRKYRSQTFSDLVGQGAVSRALQGAIASGRVAHAYLFSGSRGTGKTSTARLLAKAVNCANRDAGSAEPCNRCESCLSVLNGSALDLIEIDAASNRGIDEIRDLREKVHLAPALGNRKVYIIDEAHMLTSEAFNALLKTLEEPPDHVIFILCTTEAQKVPLTVLGRCQQFVFRRFNEDEIAGRLRGIAQAESIDAEEGVFQLIARVAQGSMRDAVGLLDQLVPLAGGSRVTVELARELLGIADPRLITELFTTVMAARPADALRLLGQVYEGGVELRQLVRALLERCRDELVGAIERRDDSGRQRFAAVLDALLHLDGEVRRHAEPRFLVEATLVRVAVEHAAPADGPAAVAERVTVTPIVTPAPAAVVPVGPAPSDGGSAGGGDLQEGWREAIKGLKPSVRAFFLDARPERDGHRLVLWFRYGFHHKSAQEHAADIKPLVEGWLGDGVEVDFRLQDVSTAASAPAARPPAPEEDPLVQAMVRQLEGRVTRVRELSQ